jgi:hypothetical protein
MTGTGTGTAAALTKWVQYFERESVQETIRARILDPVVQYVLRQMFPYVILICVMFSLLLLSSLLTLGVVIIQLRSVATAIPPASPGP